MSDPESISDQKAPTDQRYSTPRRIAQILDNRFVDPIIGFLAPGIGDLLSSAAGLYVLIVAIRNRVHKIVIARMLLNLAIDAAVGMVPIFGDAFDFVFRAHSRNLILLERSVEGPTKWTDWLVVFGAVALFLATLLAPFFLFLKFVLPVI